MTSKKTTAKRGRPKAKQPEPIQMTKDELSEILLAEERNKSSKLEMLLVASDAKTEELSYRLKQKEIGQMLQEKTKIHKENASHLNALTRKLESTYSIEAGSLSYDDETGMIYVNGEQVYR